VDAAKVKVGEGELGFFAGSLGLEFSHVVGGGRISQMMPVTTVGVAVDVGVGVGVGEDVDGLGAGLDVVGEGSGEDVDGLGSGLDVVGEGSALDEDSDGLAPLSAALTPIAVGLASNGLALLLHTVSTAPSVAGQVNGV
jgi:hypothetical protein